MFTVAPLGALGRHRTLLRGVQVPPGGCSDRFRPRMHAVSSPGQRGIDLGKFHFSPKIHFWGIFLTCPYRSRVDSDRPNVLDFTENSCFFMISQHIYVNIIVKNHRRHRGTARRPGERPARPWGATRLAILEILENHSKSQFSADPELQIEYL